MDTARPRRGARRCAVQARAGRARSYVATMGDTTLLLAALVLASTPATIHGAASVSTPSCPGAGWTLMAEAVAWRGDTYAVCEEATPGGALQFQSLGSRNDTGVAGEPSNPPE